MIYGTKYLDLMKIVLEYFQIIGIGYYYWGYGNIKYCFNNSYNYIFNLGTLSFSFFWTEFMIMQIVIEIWMCRRYCNRYVLWVLVEETRDIEKDKNDVSDNCVILLSS